MILHLGVIDISYAPPPAAPGARRKARRSNRPHKAHESKYRNVTTGDVAQWLENRYHVMEHYWELHQEDIAKSVENSLQGAIESFLMGAPVNFNALGTAISEIEDGFKRMLSEKELDRLGYPGIPTHAAEMGVSHRFKRAYVRRPPRPSLIDTGLYQASFKAWVD